jgi:MFS family permease
MAAFGFMNIIGIIQQYLHNNQLKQYSDASVGWIFSVFIFLSLFCGIQVGPIFDAHGPKWLIVAGGFLVSVSAFLLGNCTRK